MSRADKLAFPHVVTDDYDSVEPGMTLLEHYAGLAMQGLCAASGSAFREESHLNACAGLSVQLARKLIAELEKQS